MTHMQSPTTLCGRTSGSCGRIPNVHHCFCRVKGPVWSRCLSRAPEPGTQGSELKLAKDGPCKHRTLCIEDQCPTFTEEGAISGGESSSKPNSLLRSARTSA